MSYYTIKNLSTGRYLSIDNYTGALANSQNVSGITYSASLKTNNEHIWDIGSLGSGVYVKSYANPTFGLNVYRSGDPYNCNIHKIAGNETDAKIDFIYNDSLERYLIKLTNYNLYLTSSGSDVYWTTYGGESNHTQFWTISEATLNGTALEMRKNLNQKFESNDDIIKKEGCCVCCCCDVASFHGNRAYTLIMLKRAGVYTDTSAAVIWGNVPAVKTEAYTASSQSAYLSKIKSEIDNENPVLIHMVGNYQHWVVAYGYTSDCTDIMHVRVLDPYNPDTSTINGRDINLAFALLEQGATTISDLRLTMEKEQA